VQVCGELNEALPQDSLEFTIPDFGRDALDAIRRYFDHYRINTTDFEFPIELLSHPLTLFLFCEVSNPKREQVVGIEKTPGSLIALFERYLEQVRSASSNSLLAPNVISSTT
jgi:hypothetical protein